MDTIWIECEDGVERPFHAQVGELNIQEPILDENGELIPKYSCLCAARSDSECCCGSWSGDYDYYFSEEYSELQILEDKLKRQGYNLDELEQDNPHNQWLYE